MKRNSLSLLALNFLLVVGVSAQSNTFPSSGNVGIGTTTPTWPLVVLSGSPVVGIMRSVASVQNSGLVFGTGQGSVDFQMYVPANSSDLHFYKSGELFTFTADAKLGIGTTTPAASLDVGGLAASGTLRTVFARQAEGNTTGSGTFLGVKAWGTQGTNYNGKMFSIENAFYGYLNSSIEFYRGGSTQGGFVTFTTGDGTERLRIDPIGNVGIGTTSPVAKLDVISDAPSSVANLILRSGQDRTPRIRFNGPWSVANPSESYAEIVAINDNGGPGNSAASLHFYTSAGDPAVLSDCMMVSGAGNVGIGTTTPTQKLSVNGTIRAKEVIVDTGWSDYVFEKDYRLAPLAEVEHHIKTEKHLPGIPSAADVAAHGVSVGDMQAKLLAKIEEITLRQIAQEKQIDTLMGENAALEAENRAMHSRMDVLESR